MRFISVICFLLLAGCSSGAVIFAPTAPPPDVSPLRYAHPSGAFVLSVPRTWAVYEQNTTTLASAAFTPPGAYEPVLVAAAVKLSVPPEDSQAFAALIFEYQTAIRPDLEQYQEQDRQAMGDGSWRLTGVRNLAGGRAQQVNTFIERSNALVGVLEVVIPADSAQFNEAQNAINTFRLNADAALESAEMRAFAAMRRAPLEIMHVSAWKTAAGVFFITGEVANMGITALSDVPVRAVLYTVDGLGAAEALDTVMGYSIPPGGFAPFSLRFGQGQPALTDKYILEVGSAAWNAADNQPVFDARGLTWQDERGYTDLGHLRVSGSVTNIGSGTAHNLRAVVTVFDSENNVIAAGFTDIQPPALAPGESAPFQLIVPELGGFPANHIVNIQGLP